MTTTANRTSFEEGFRLLKIGQETIANRQDSNLQKCQEAKGFSIYSAIIPCQLVSNSNSSYPEDKNAKLG